MGKYEDLLSKYSYITVTETNKLPKFQSGLYINGEIFINSNRSTNIKHETLAEEISHHKITYGDITDQTNIQNKRYELKARRLANEQIISLSGIIEAYEYGVENCYEMAEFFEVTEKYVCTVIQHYKQKYGLSICYKGYQINFEPLQVFKI